MPGVSPKLGSTVSSVNPSQLNSSAEGSRSICRGANLFIPWDSEMLMASLSAVIILLSLPSRSMAMEMYVAGSRDAGPQIRRECTSLVVVKAKLLCYPKLKSLVHPSQVIVMFKSPLTKRMVSYYVIQDSKFNLFFFFFFAIFPVHHKTCPSLQTGTNFGI